MVTLLQRILNFFKGNIPSGRKAQAKALGINYNTYRGYLSKQGIWQDVPLASMFRHYVASWLYFSGSKTPTDVYALTYSTSMDSIEGELLDSISEHYEYESQFNDMLANGYGYSVMKQEGKPLYPDIEVGEL